MSMTGYGRFDDSVGKRRVAFEIRTVNSKYFEFSARVPRGFGFVENRLKKYIQQSIQRGKVDVFLQMYPPENAEAQVNVNEPMLAGYYSALSKIKSDFSLPDDVTLELLSGCPDIFLVQKPPEDEEEVWQDVKTAVDVSLKALLQMRMGEGENLRRDIFSHIDGITALVGRIEELSPQSVERYRERLKEKITELTEERPVDEQRLLTEVAIFADKIAVDEETVRLKSHMQQMKKLLSEDEPVGRRADFLVQEMNREANTIGSKCSLSEISYLVVEVKAEIEKMREQIQNIE